jgi:hypothetical protein
MMQPLRNFSSADKTKIIVAIIFMGVLLTLLGFLVGMLLRPSQIEFSRPILLVQATPTISIPVTGPTVSAADCKSPTLLLGTTTFQIQDLRRGADGSLAVPGDTSGIAYRVAGTGSNTVFVLSPTPQNITVMSTISIGSAATVMGAACASATYSLSAAQAGALDGSVFADQPEEQVIVFFPTASSGAGFVFKGRPITEPVLALIPATPIVENALPVLAENTVSPSIETTVTSAVMPATATEIPAMIPTPDYSEVLAEIGVLDTSLSLFGTSLRIEVSIYNFGKIPIPLSERDVTLTQPDSTALALKSSKPRLPKEIQPGETKTFEFSFEPPSSPTATVKILTVEYDIEGY